MESIDHLYSQINGSDVVLMGYTFKYEVLKDEFISRLSHKCVGEVDSSSAFKQIIRDIKVNQLLDNSEKFEWLVLDISQISHSARDTTFGFTKAIRKLVTEIRDYIYNVGEDSNEDSEFGLDFDDPDSHEQKTRKKPFRLLITTPMYKSIDNSKYGDTRSFTGGDGPIFMSDIAFVIKENKLPVKPYIKVVKNRMGGEYNVSVDDLLKPIERERKINKLLVNTEK